MRARTLLAGLIVCGAADASAMCRMIVERGSAPPIVDPAQSVLLILRHDISMGQSCPPAPPDMSLLDAGGFDLAASTTPDLALADGAMLDDAGSFSDAGRGAADLSPGCGPLRGDAVTMVVQPQFSTGSGGSHFAMLTVTPAVPTVDVASPTLFHDLAVTSAPLINTVDKRVEDPSLGTQQCQFTGCGSSLGSLSNETPPPNFSPTQPADADAGIPASPTRIGNYDVAVLAGANLLLVEAWLSANNYLYTQADVQALEPYLDAGWTVTAVRVHADHQVMNGAFDPLSFTFAGSELRLPIGLARDPSQGPAPVTVYVAAEQRYELTALQRKIPYAEEVAFGGANFLTRNDVTLSFDTTMDADPVAEPAGDVTTHDVVTVVNTVRVPVERCSFCACDLGGRLAGSSTLVILFFGAFTALAARRLGRARR